MPSRRRFLASASALGAGLAGCSALGLGTREAWRVALDDGVANDRATAVAVADGSAYVVAETPPTPTITALSLPDGGREWQADLDGANLPGITPAVGDGHVYVPEMAGHRISAFTTDGDAAWTYRFDGEDAPKTTPLVADGRLVVGLDRALVALDT